MRYGASFTESKDDEIKQEQKNVVKSHLKKGNKYANVVRNGCSTP